MAKSVGQMIVSSYTQGKYAELNFVIKGATDESDAVAQLLADPNCVDSFNSIPRYSVGVTAEHINSSSPDSNIWRGVVVYMRQLAEIDGVVSFDTTGGTQNITQSLNTARYPAGAPDFQGGINYDGDKLNGVDIGIGALEFTEVHYKNLSQVDDDYRAVLASLTYGVNDDTFRGHAAGEVLFKGAIGQKVYVDTVERWQLSFKFAVSPNRSNFSIGSVTGISKLGWDYLWVLYSDAISASVLIKQPVGVYVERIYSSVDFSELEID